MVKAVLAEAGHSVLMRRFEGQLNDPNQLGCLFTDAASRADPHPCGRLVEKQCWGAEHRRRAGVRGGAAEVWCCVDGKVSLSPYPPLATAFVCSQFPACSHYFHHSPRVAQITPVRPHSLYTYSPHPPPCSGRTSEGMRGGSKTISIRCSTQTGVKRAAHSAVG